MASGVITLLAGAVFIFGWPVKRLISLSKTQ